MTFRTEKKKLEKAWNKVEEITANIIQQKADNEFIINGIDELNRQNTFGNILVNFTSNWLQPEIVTGSNDNDEEIILGNFQEFRLRFNTTDIDFASNIRSDIVYRVGNSGVIPFVDDGSNSEEFFDEQIGDSNRLEKRDIYQITDTYIDYISYIRMNFGSLNNDSNPNVEYKFICYIINPRYFQAS